MIYLFKKSIQTTLQHRQFSARAVSFLIFSVLVLLLVVHQEDVENYFCSTMNLLRITKGSAPGAIHSHISETLEEKSQWRGENWNSSSSTRMLPSLIVKKSFDLEVMCGYKDNDDDWIYLGAISGDENHAKSGSSISLSADGTVLAIGTRFSDVNGLNSGMSTHF